MTLSIGYYHEQPTDQITDIAMARLMRELGRAGVLVVAAAGNDATNRPLLPAGFAGQVVGLERDALPLVSVGSLNPGQASVSLFSNAGEWVTTYRPGASIVSTLPVTQDASAQPSRHAAAAPGDQRTRATIDPDDYSGGFGVWSGTSFAAPVLAGELAQQLVQQGPEDVHLDALIERGWKALSSVLRPCSALRHDHRGDGTRAEGRRGLRRLSPGRPERLADLVRLLTPAVAHGTLAERTGCHRRGRRADRMAAAHRHGGFDRRSAGRSRAGSWSRSSADLAPHALGGREAEVSHRAARRPDGTDARGHRGSQRAAAHLVAAHYGVVASLPGAATRHRSGGAGRLCRKVLRCPRDANGEHRSHPGPLSGKAATR
ncbi:MAG: S8 family serine peptidase [Micropruina sp.]|nr:S8 family serine peptidase [Micropruina sp.]